LAANEYKEKENKNKNNKNYKSREMQYVTSVGERDQAVVKRFFDVGLMDVVKMNVGYY
jgi:hypothetical protein